MENKKDIGKAFRDKLSDLDQMPGDFVWTAINSDLEKKRKRRVLFYFFSAAAFIIFAGLFVIFKDNFGGNSNDKVKSDDAVKINTDSITANEVEENFELLNTTNTLFQQKEVFKSKASTSKKLVKSTDEIDEYEVVTRYKIYVKKSKTKEVVTNSKVVKGSRNVVGIKSAADKKAKALNLKSGKKVAAKSAKTTKVKSGSKKKQLKKSKIKSNSDYVPSLRKKTSLKSSWSNRSKSASKNKLATTLKSEEEIIAGKIDTTDPDEQKLNEGIVDSTSILTPDSTAVKTDTVSKPPKVKREYKEPVAKVEEQKNDNVFISVVAGASYYNFLSKSSALIKNGDDYEKSAKIDLGYGVYVRRMLNEKIGFRAGITFVNYAQTTKIKNDDQQAFVLQNTFVKSGITKDDLTSLFPVGAEITFDQQFKYLEFPLEVYIPVRSFSSFGIDAFAGFSTYFLTKDQVTATGNGNSVFLGEAENVKNVSFGLNLGANLYYTLTKRLQIDLAPAFKYQLKPTTNGTAAMNFYLQAGLTFKL